MTVLLLTNSHGDLAEINPEYGATLSRLFLHGEEVIKYPLKADDPAKGYPSALLFPFPNRIKDGRYHFNGTEYNLDINDSDSGSAIHGLIAFKPFEIEKKDKSSATLVYNYLGENDGYPFPYQFRITYTLKKARLNVKVEAQNTGDSPMPFGFGWHPYFGFSGRAISEMEVTAPDRYKVELSDRFIPTGEAFLEKAATLTLKNTILDNVFIVANDTKLTEITLKYLEKRLIISQESGKQKLNYFILYTPPSRDCIAIEPQSCNTNAFNNGEGLQVLQPGATVNFKVAVRVEA